jgi:uncharacterized protein YecE (DUF72 family)
MAHTPQIRIGVSGWRYPPWRGVFYPEDLKQDLELAYASRQLSTIELNGSFYSLQRPENYQNWTDATPKNFLFSVKGPRYITHILRLRDCEIAVANFFASGLFRLGDKLGPILWQFPANFSFDAARLAQFFAWLPRDGPSAAALAKRHDRRFDGRVSLGDNGIGRIRHVIEIRNASFATPEFVDLLRESDIGLVVSDSDGRWPVFEDVTSDLVYIRLHGHEALYASGYDAPAIERWGRRIGDWVAGREPADARRIASLAPSAPRDVFCYFDNDAKVMAPRDARALMKLLELPMEPEVPNEQP